MVVGRARPPQCSSTGALTFSGRDCQKCGTIEDMKRGTDSTRGLSLDTVLRKHLASWAVMLALTVLTGLGPARADVESGVIAYEGGDFESAAAELQKKPEDPKAAYYLGLMHENGLGGFRKNYATALNWIEKSGSAGHIEAQLKAASMYALGLGAPASARKAAQWYRRAAEKGDVAGQLHLGTMYRDGVGVPRDRYRASLWLGRAGEQGNSDAIQALQDMRRQGLISGRELVTRLAGVPVIGLTLTERGQRVRGQLAYLLDPIRFIFGQSKKAVPARELNDHWIIVERENDVLALLSDVSVLTDEGDIVEVGTIRILAVPQENDTLDFALSIPSKVVVRNSLGEIVSTIMHDQFQISGKWSEALRTAPDVEVRWTGIDALVEDGPLQINVGAISGHFSLSQIEPAIWRQASGFEVDSIRAIARASDAVFKIGRATFKSEVDGVHPDAYKRFVSMHVPGFEGPQPRDQASSNSAGLNVTDIESQVASVLGRRLEASLEFSGLFADAGNGSPSMELASGNFLVGLSDLDQALSALELNFGYDGLKAEHPTAGVSVPTGSDGSGEAVAEKDIEVPASGQNDMADLSHEVPDRVAMDIVVERVPLRGIATSILGGFLESWAGALKGGQAVPAQPEFMPLMLQSTAELMEAGTRLVLNRLEVRGSDYGIAGNGALGADPAAAYQVSGELDLAVTNLRKALQYEAVRAFLPGAENLVESLDEVGQAGTAEGAKNYRVEVTQLGSVLVNGRDLAVLLQEAGDGTE